MTSILNFKARFVSRIEDRTKQQTIRAERKRNPVPGEALRLQAGDRFHPVLIGWSSAVSVDPIRIDVGHDLILLGHLNLPILKLDKFAVLDGFDDWKDMQGFWRETHPTLPVFSGWRTFWGDSYRKEAAL